MKLEDQVCSLEIAKKLKELGVRQDGLFWYDEHFPDPYKVELKAFYAALLNPHWAFRVCSAYTVAELGKILKGHELPYLNFGTGWQTRQIKDYHRPKTEADARAMLLIYLIENKLLNPPNP